MDLQALARLGGSVYSPAAVEAAEKTKQIESKIRGRRRNNRPRVGTMSQVEREFARQVLDYIKAEKGVNE